MRQPTLFDEEPIAAAPIARASDPVTSHEAAAKTESSRTLLQQKCLEVWARTGRELAVNELATLVMQVHFAEIRKSDDRYMNQWQNCRKRSNEVANKHCQEITGMRRNGCRVFRLKEPTR